MRRKSHGDKHQFLTVFMEKMFGMAHFLRHHKECMVISVTLSSSIWKNQARRYHYPIRGCYGKQGEIRIISAPIKIIENRVCEEGLVAGLNFTSKHLCTYLRRRTRKGQGVSTVMENDSFVDSDSKNVALLPRHQASAYSSKVLAV